VRRLLVAVVVLVLIGVGLAVRFWGGTASEERRVLAVIEEGKRLVEEEDYGRLASVVWPEYSDSFGMTYQTLLYSLRMFFDNVEDVQLDVSRQRLEVAGKHAEAELVVTFSWRQLGGGRAQDAVRLRVSFEQRKRRWKILNVDELPLRFD